MRHFLLALRPRLSDPYERELEWRNHLQGVYRRPSDLAREAFGTKIDNRGYTVARKRDRISVYLRGLQTPDPKNLGLLAGGPLGRYPITEGRRFGLN